MAHFAKIDSQTNVVLEVHVVDNSDIQNLEFPESESIGVDFLTAWTDTGTYWKQTSYNGTIRKNYAGIGYAFDESRNAFIPPQPFPSWTLVEETCRWVAPVAYPADEKAYIWDEAALSWIEFIKETP